MDYDEDDDDLELDRSDDDVSPSPSLPGGGPGPMLAAAGAVLLVVLALVVFLFLRFRAQPPAPSPLPELPTLAAQPSPSPSPSPEPSDAALPSLDQSDAFVRGLAKTLSQNPQVESWFAVGGLVRRFVAVVVNVAQGENPAPHLRFLDPEVRLHAVSRGRTLVIDPASYARFDVFADAAASVDAQAAADLYRRLGPLLDAAARDLGQPAGEFDLVTSRALASLLAAPVLEGDVAVVSNPPFFRYADKGLESLAPAQKQLIRMGPRNERLIQGKLKELSTALALPEPR
jgi:hypothetical protein